MVLEPDTTSRTLGYLEGRITEQAAGLQDLRQELAGFRQEVRAEFQEVRAGLQEVNQRLDQGLQAVNSRIDRMFLATWAIGGGIIAALVVMIIRSG
jgi:type VI protein secretion system component VasF